MFSKPLNLILVYIVTVFNVMILVSPLAALALPFINFSQNSIAIDNGILQKIKLAFAFLLFAVSLLMLVYFVLDFLLGFSVRASLKSCTRYEKIKDYDFLTELFDQVKNKFGEKNVRLYVKNSNEINAFAVSSVGSKAIVLTKGLIDHFLVSCPDPKTFLYSLRSIVGHEMSHLINKDFLPTFLIITNQKVTNSVSRILHLIFAALVRMTSFVPGFGAHSSVIMWKVYSSINFIITIFNRLIVYNLYEFLRRFVSRSLEYRCDRQSALAFGGQNMALALSKLGKSGYFTLFSTHPQTASRIKKVSGIKISDSVVRPGIIDSITNYISIMLLIIIFLIFAKEAGIDLLVRDLIRDHEMIHRKLLALWQLVKSIY